MPFFTGLILRQLAYRKDLMASVILTNSLASPLRTRLDDTILKLASNPHQKSIFLTNMPKQCLHGRPKETRGYISPKIGDRWHFFRDDSHSHDISLYEYMTTTMSWTTLHELMKFTTRTRGYRGEGGTSINWKIARKSTDIG